MAIVYDFKKLPHTSGSDEEAARLYPQAVKLKTITFKELAEEIEEATTYTVADLRGLMEAVVQAAAKHLNASEHVELEGLGTLSLSIACDKDEEGHQPVITSPDQVKPHHLHVSRVNFDAKPEFIKALKGPFARAETPFPMNQERAIPTPDERRTLLLNHLDERGYISTTTYMQLTRLTRRQASAELNAFVASGLLARSGSATHVVFVRG